MSKALDDATINRAAPPGSMRYFTLLYTPPETRDVVTALFVIEAEIRESAFSANHDVAHTRLQWWRQEIDRLVNDNAQHPATRVLSASGAERKSLAKLHELIVAADMDLARMTYLNDGELRAYCARSGGPIAELIATRLVPSLDDPTRATSNRLGALVRATELVRDVRQDAYDGRLYLPLDRLEHHAVKHDSFRAQDLTPQARVALQETAQKTLGDIEAMLASIPASSRAYLRPLFVLAGLHAALLRQIARLDYQVGASRIDLGPIRKPWTAWRYARRAA
jgi:15-cis-phytoene synthase